VCLLLCVFLIFKIFSFLFNFTCVYVSVWLEHDFYNNNGSNNYNDNGYCPWGGQHNRILLILVFLGLFILNLWAKTVSDWPRELATLTFDLGGHGACRWYGSSCSIYVPSLKFVDLSARSEAIHTFNLSINRPSVLDLWLFDLETGAPYCPWARRTWASVYVQPS